MKRFVKFDVAAAAVCHGAWLRNSTALGDSGDGWIAQLHLADLVAVAQIV